MSSDDTIAGGSSAYNSPQRKLESRPARYAFLGVPMTIHLSGGGSSRSSARNARRHLSLLNLTASSR